MRNAKSKNEIDCVVVDAWCILKDVSVMSSFNKESDHRLFQAIMRARIYIISAVEKSALNVSSRRNMKIYEKELLQQVEASDRRMAVDIKEDYQCFAEKLFQCVKKPKVPS